MGDFKSWQAVQDEVLRRIHARIWAPGDMIPNEQDLADEFGCARATVNRALRNLSDDGLLERRRKAGTRVALHPVRRATLRIPMIRQEIESRNQTCSYMRVLYQKGAPTALVRARMAAPEGDEFVRVKSVHLADGIPFVYEDRWINLTTIPEARSEDFMTISANEWLLTKAAFTRGEISFSARSADEETAEILGTSPGTAIFEIERTTWNNDRAITTVSQRFQPGYKMQTSL